MFRVATLTTLFSVVALGAAQANCARDVQDMKPRVAQIKDAKARERAQDYLQRAVRELDENEEFDCQSAIGVIEKILKDQPK